MAQDGTRTPPQSEPLLGRWGAFLDAETEQKWQRENSASLHLRSREPMIFFLLIFVMAVDICLLQQQNSLDPSDIFVSAVVIRPVWIALNYVIVFGPFPLAIKESLGFVTKAGHRTLSLVTVALTINKEGFCQDTTIFYSAAWVLLTLSLVESHALMAVLEISCILMSRILVLFHDASAEVLQIKRARAEIRDGNLEGVSVSPSELCSLGPVQEAQAMCGIWIVAVYWTFQVDRVRREAWYYKAQEKVH